MAITGTFLADFSSFQAAVSKAEVSLKSFETGAGKVEKSLTRVTNSLSGTKLIQDATIAAQAVDKIGGVSKLTESELRRVGATATEAAAKLKAMGQDVPPGIQKIADAAARAGNETSKLGGFLKSAFSQFTLAGLATTAITKVIGGIGDLVATGMKLPAMERAFGNLTSSMAQDGQAMLANMKQATQGLVGNYALMASANKAMLLGLPITAQSMGELAKTATVLGRAMGQDATASLNDLITALGRSSPMILDNLGLTVKVGEANEAYARKLGKSVEAMTEAEKKMAFYEAAMEAARKKTAQLGEQTLTLGERMTTVWNRIEDTVSRDVGNMNVVIGHAISSWKNFFDFLGQSAQFKSWEEMRKALDAMQKGQRALPELAPGALARPSAIALNEELLRQVKSITAAERARIQVLKDQGFNTEQVAAQTLISKEALEVLDRQLQATTRATTAQTKKEREIAEEYKQSAAALKKYEMLVFSTNDLLTKTVRASGDAKRAQYELNQAFEAGKISVTGLLVALKDAPIALQGIYTTKSGTFGGGTPIDLITQMGEATKSWTAANVTAGVELRNVAGGVRAVGDEIGIILKGKLIDQLKEDVKQIPDIVMQAFVGGGGLKGAADAIGSLIGKRIGGKIGEEIGKALGGSGEWGKLIGEAIGSAIPQLLNKIFDRNKGRDVMKDFAASFRTFDLNTLQFSTTSGFSDLQRKLQQLFDPATAEKYWIAVTQGVGRNNPEQAKAVIGAISDAIAEQEQRIADVKTQVAGLVQAHLGAQFPITAALQAQIDKLIEAKVLTADNAREMLGLAANAVPAFADVKAAADTLGLSLDGIGGKISNLAFAEKVGEVTGALKTLELAGADMAEVYRQAVKKIQPLLTEALKFGKEMPEEMRPTLQKMIDMGLLTDDAGKKLTDLTGVNFAEPLSKKFDDLIVKLGELVDAILGPKGVGGALDELGRRVVTPRVKVIYDDTGAPPVYPQAKGGDYWVTKPTMFLAGEAGPERATFTPAGGTGPAGNMHITLVMPDGDVLLKQVVRAGKRLGYG